MSDVAQDVMAIIKKKIRVERDQITLDDRLQVGSPGTELEFAL